MVKSSTHPYKNDFSPTFLLSLPAPQDLGKNNNIKSLLMRKSSKIEL